MNKISCMIVTYNRCDLLKQCLDALDEQTCQDFDITVLNNGSTDDTKEYVEERTKKSHKLINLVNVEKNKGMAYGYNRGYAAVFERGYEWIWTMDDDGLPEKNQLERLLSAQKETGLLYLNAIVCDINNHHKLAFNLPGISDPLDNDIKYVYGTVRPDNGTLINHTIFENCGNIKSELISYGMETEFLFRIKEAGFQVATVCDAFHYHPCKSSKTTSIIKIGKFNKFFVYNPLFFSNDGYLSYLRSLGFITEKYMRSRIINEYVRLLLFWVSRFWFTKIPSYIKAFNEGRNNIFPEI